MEVIIGMECGHSLKTWLHIWVRNRSSKKRSPFYRLYKPMTCGKFWLGLTGTCRSQVTLILTGNEAVLLEEQSMQCCSLTTTFCRRGDIKLGKHPSVLILKRDQKNLQLIQRWQEMIQLTLTILLSIMTTCLYFITQ
jgi:hypothetical protein